VIEGHHQVVLVGQLERQLNFDLIEEFWLFVVICNDCHRLRDHTSGSTVTVDDLSKH
jgi:hypothetical protein